MSKHKSGKRLNKKMLVEMLQTLFQQKPNETFTLKDVFKNLKLSTHPAKMLAVETMDEMAWDDFLTKTSANSYRLNLKNQVQEGTFIRKANGKNSFQPDDGGKSIFVSERNSLFAMNGDRVRVAMMARRERHMKEAMVVEILSHKVDQAVGKLKVERDYAFLVTEGNIFVHDILIPKKKLKGGKDGEKAVVRITQWPSKDSKNIVGEVIDVLGKEGDNNVEMHAILAQYGLPYKYPKAVEDAAEKIDPGITPQEIARREDFREVFTCTIDPRDAKDFDDALSIRSLPLSPSKRRGDSKAPSLLGEGGGRGSKTFVYRVHDQPDPTKLETLREFVVKFGYKMKTSGTKGAISKSLNALMDGCQGKKEQKLIETVALRAMMKAKYSTHNIGHYGLAFEYYTHFTSPIRRYPDTMVHRLLTKYQDGARSANQEKYEELCEHCSDMEQVAQQAERDSIKYKMVEFMADKVGEVYDAHISGIQSYGIYCEIDENHCEGMVPMHNLDDDYYDFDERNYCLVGRHHHNKYQLGDPVRIRVARANMEKRQLDFELAEEEGKKSKKGKVKA